jgi:multidrug transporter EmrE-like cation transporter
VVVILTLMVMGQLLAKHGAAILSRGWDEWRAAAPFLVLAYAALFSRGLLWVLVLRRVALSLAYPVMALAYVAVLGASWVLYDDAIGPMKVVGALFIVAGVVVLGLCKMRDKG